MSNAHLGMLDQEEIFHAALQASGNGDSVTAIAYLKEAVSRSDATAAAHYLLGAEYAQIQLYGRAIDAMEAAIALDPALHMARLQLGMLYLGRSDSARAVDVLEVLAQLGEVDPLHHFASGLLHLVRDERQAARDALEKGIGLNLASPALNGDMQRIVQDLGRLPATVTAATPAAEDQQHVLLSAYSFNRTP
jgi:tetratricopeptide (TPR) repeat protein